MEYFFMAKVHEEVIVVKLSKLLKNDQDTTSIFTEDAMYSLEQVVQELVGAPVIVEVEKA
jgi:hypothetical protein